MNKALIAGVLSVNGVSAIALTSQESVYESVPYSWEFDYDTDYDW